MRAARLVLFSLVAGCGGGGPAAAPAAAPPPVSNRTEVPAAVAAELSPALAPLAWLVGDWQSEISTEHWHAVGGALWGVALARDGRFEVMAIDDAGAAVTLYAMPSGQRPAEFRATALEGERVVFANPAHDAPKTVTYERRGAGLRATLDADTKGAVTFGFFQRALAPSPVLLAADRAWAADTAAHGVDGALRHFAADGGMLAADSATLTGAALHAQWEQMLAPGTLTWAPVASGATARIGFTIGKARLVPRDASAVRDFSYVTIWRPEPDGTWKVLFDTFRAVDAVP